MLFLTSRHLAPKQDSSLLPNRMDILELYTYFKRCSGVTTDSRAPKRDSLFIALKGERFDGNDFTLDALAKGCAYAVVDHAELAQKEAR